MKKFLIAFSGFIAITVAAAIVSIAAFVYTKFNSSPHIAVGSKTKIEKTTDANKMTETSIQSTIVAANPATKSTAHSPKPKTQEKDLAYTLAEEALRLDRTTDKPEEDELNLTRIAEQLSAKDAEELKNVALNSSATHNQRFLAVYLLGKRPLDFMPALREIAVHKTPLLFTNTQPHTTDEIDKSLEVTVRATALSAIDSVNDKSDQREFFTLMTKHKNITLQRLARVGLMGAMKQEPLIAEYIDAKLEGALGEIQN